MYTVQHDVPNRPPFYHSPYFRAYTLIGYNLGLVS